MASGIDFPTFYDRFEHLRRKLRRHLGWQTLTVLAIGSLLGFLAIAGLDYRFEMPWLIRAVWLAIASAAAVVVAGWLLIAGLTRWNRGGTASAIEHRFPELGQRVRTTVEYRGRSNDQLKSVGVAPGLVRALETEAAVSTLPLPLENLIPIKRLIALAAVAGAILGFVTSASLWNGEWKTALRRALLADESFSHLVLSTGNETVDKGTGLNLKANLRGRSRDSVILRTRPLDRADNSWDEQTFTMKDGDLVSADEWAFASFVPNITAPFAYQWVAGPERSPEYQVDVRYPLEIASMTVTATPPEYTGLPASVQMDGNLNVLEGTDVSVVIELDGVPTSARVVMKPTTRSKEEGWEAEVVDVRIDGRKLTFEQRLTHEVNWSVEATSAYGISLAENSYRIRVRKDQPPTVYFEEPSESLDVHSLAEILMRIRVRDDYGLIRAGIVFQVNNDEEHTLFAEDYQQAADELASTGNMTPKTAAALERTLPLEHFKLIQKDAITYYGFAEDNRPGEPQRTETELRFIDIRPFKITYRLPPERDGNGTPQEQGPRRATFEELIGRQRTALNRTLAMKRAKAPDLSGLDRLMKFEKEIAELTNGLAVFLQATAQRFQIPALLDNADLLFQAERAMLDSIDSMSVGKFDVAMLQEKDAVRFLIESRDRLIVILQNQNNPAGLENAINQFFREQQTKLRMKPKANKDEQEKAKDLLDRLAQLASQQSIVAAQLDSMGPNGGSQTENPEQPPTPQDGDTQKPANPNPNPDAAQKNAGQSGTSDSEEQPEPKAVFGQMSREEISKAQQDLAADAASVRKDLDQMRQSTELAKRRMASATESAEAASGALVRGNTKEAAKSANTAAEKFEELLALAQGLFAEELADQLNVARDMAEDISRREEDFSNRTDAAPPTEKPRKPGTGSDPADAKEKQEAVARMAEKLAAQGESLSDILNSATKSTSAADQKMIPKVTELLDKGGVASAIERMQQQPEGVRTGRLEEEKKAAADIADRLDEAARKLDALQREIVNPKIAEMMKLEEKAKGLEAELDDVETRRQTEKWVQGAGEFLEDLKNAQTGIGSDEELKEKMKGYGWDEATNTLRGNGSRVFDRHQYRNPLRRIAEELRENVQKLLLAELAVMGEEVPPAQYEAMVTKYQRVLTMGVGETKGTKARERRSK